MNPTADPRGGELLKNLQPTRTHRAGAYVLGLLGILLLAGSPFLPWARYGPEALLSATVYEVYGVAAGVTLLLVALALVVAFWGPSGGMRSAATMIGVGLLAAALLVSIHAAMWPESLVVSSDGSLGADMPGIGTIIVATGAVLAALGLLTANKPVR